MATQKSPQKILNTIIDLQGVIAVSLIGRDGFVIESASHSEIDLDALGAVASTGFGSSEVMASELNLGTINQTIVECDEGKILMADCGDAILAVVTNEEAIIGSIRHNIRKVVNELTAII
ncbi:MAG: roadblock/LC7 domain-containing protein [Candidatus Hodarchaeota archaeon]